MQINEEFDQEEEHIGGERTKHITAITKGRYFFVRADHADRTRGREQRRP